MALPGVSIEDQVLVPCPRCGEKTASAVVWLRTNPTYRCPFCGTFIDIEVNEAADTIGLGRRP